MKVWLQQSDFSSHDLPDSSMGFAVKALDSFNWAGQREAEQDASERGEECCPAGMGFSHEDGPILHVIPVAADRFDVHYMCMRSRRFLGISLSKNAAGFLEGASTETVKQLIEKHYSGAHDEVRVAFEI